MSQNIEKQGVLGVFEAESRKELHGSRIVNLSDARFTDEDRITPYAYKLLMASGLISVKRPDSD
jgi:hypothetical protein